MQLFVGVTDLQWFENLQAQRPTVSEVNFWRPSGQPFGAVPPGSPFLFKLKTPINKIAGVGFFRAYMKLPVRIAWEAFTTMNGRDSYEKLRSVIAKLSSDQAASGLKEIGCILLDNPVFFDESDWIEPPADFSLNIVSGKSYDATAGKGLQLWERVQALIREGSGRTARKDRAEIIPTVFGKEYLRKSRPGQAGFRLGLTEAYNRRCAITGENILPVLEAAHIQPVSKNGTNDITNGLLLRSDMHILYDEGLLTVTPDYNINVSPAIRDAYVNGKVYYTWDNKKLTSLPSDIDLQPDKEKLEWHYQSVFVR